MKQVPIFLDLVDRGIMHVLDALFVRKDADGTFSGFDLADLDQDTTGDLTAFAGATTGLSTMVTSHRLQPKWSPEVAL